MCICVSVCLCNCVCISKLTYLTGNSSEVAMFGKRTMCENMTLLKLKTLKYIKMTWLAVLLSKMARNESGIPSDYLQTCGELS